MNNLLIYHGLVGGGEGRSASSATTRTPKDLAKKLAKMQQIADRTNEEFEGENVYYDSFDGTNDKSLGKIDLTSVNITTNSSNIINTIDSANLAKLKVGQEITLIKDAHIERVIIDTIENGFFTINKSIEAGKFNGGKATRSMAIIRNGKLLLEPANAVEYDIRYKITPKEKQPNKIYTWVKYDNPSICSSYDSVVSPVQENLTHYECVTINNVTIDESNFTMTLNYSVPNVKGVKLYIGYGSLPTVEKNDGAYEISDRGQATKQISLTHLDEDVYYRFITDYADGTVNESVSQSGSFKAESGVYKHTVRINRNVPDPELAVEYVGKSKLVSNWDKVAPFNQIRPVVLNETGEFVGEVDKNDFSKHVDGSQVSTALGFDLMIEFPRVYWKSVVTDTYIDITISNKKVEPNMKAYAHTTGGVDKELLYVGAFRSTVRVSNGGYKAYSSYNFSTTSGYNITGFRDYSVARGANYGLMNWNTVSLIKILFLLRYKTLHSQSVCGTGSTSNSVTTGHNPTLLKVGMTSSPSTIESSNRRIKLFGLEDMWGNGLTFIDGIFPKNGSVKIAEDNLKCLDTFNSGVDIPITFDTGNYTGGGRLEDIQGVGQQLFYAKRVTNSPSTSFYSDRFNISTNSTSQVGITAPVGDDHLGLFGFNFTTPTDTGSSLTSRLIMLK